MTKCEQRISPEPSGEFNLSYDDICRASNSTSIQTSPSFELNLDKALVSLSDAKKLYHESQPSPDQNHKSSQLKMEKMDLRIDNDSEIAKHYQNDFEASSKAYTDNYNTHKWSNIQVVWNLDISQLDKIQDIVKKKR
ncbi:hypothetical protein AKO1_003060, partial [Acrasis kona]